MFSERIHQAPTLDCLLEAILETTEKIFGFHNPMILLSSATMPMIPSPKPTSEPTPPGG